MIYNISMIMLRGAIALGATFSQKLRLMNRAYKNIIPDTKQKIALIKEGKPTAKTTWFHCASLGEFEQARPVIERLQRKQENSIIVVTFFSPSGYEVRKNYPLADAVLYLPVDTRKNARRFVQAVQADNVVIVKYEFWRNMLRNIKKSNANLILISAPFRPSMPFFKVWGTMWRKMIYLFDGIFVQNEESKQLLKSIGLEQNVIVAGDTRFDRVANVTETATRINSVERFVGQSKVLIAGSTWPEDIEALAPLMREYAASHKRWKFIIAPHEINEAKIDEMMQKFASLKVVRYTEIGESESKLMELESADLLIIDCIGILTSIYQYGTIAYVGGAFKTGLHNILEPAAWAMPVVFGPIYSKFIEAQELIDAGGARSVNNEVELKNAVTHFDQNIDDASQIACEYVKGKCGATKLIIANAPELTN